MSGQRPNRLPVNRRAGYQLIVPPNRPSAPTQRVRAQRMEALRNQLRYPHAIADSTLRWHLGRNNWDVNRAAQSFWEAEEDMDLGIPTQAEVPTQRRGETVEQTRIFQITDQLDTMTSAQQARIERLRDQQPEAGRPFLPIPPQPASLSNAEAAMLLHQREWVLEPTQRDLGRILDAQTSGEHERKALQDEIEHNLAKFRLRPRGRMEKDERLALFMSITSSNSWWSCRKFLVKHHYDVVVAVDEWMKAGGVPLVPEPLRRRHRGVRRPVLKDGGMRPYNVNNPQRITHGTFKTFPMDQPPVELSQEDRIAVSRHARRRLSERLQSHTVQRSGHPRDYFLGCFRRGYLLDDRGVSNTPAYVNCPDATKLWLEYVRRGILVAQFFPSKFWISTGRRNRLALPFSWEDGPAPTHRQVEFDWFDGSHTSRGNKWRASRIAVITGTTKKPASTPFNKYELQWLTEQDAMNIEEQFYHEAGQDVRDSGITNQGKWDRAMEKFSNFKKFPIHISNTALRDLQERFNQTFAGKRHYEKTIYRDRDGLKDVPSTIIKDMKKVGAVPRPERTEHVIAQQRRRIKTSSKRYLITINSHKQADKDKCCDELTSEEDSDFETQ